MTKQEPTMRCLSMITTTIILLLFQGPIRRMVAGTKNSRFSCFCVVIFVFIGALSNQESQKKLLRRTLREFREKELAKMLFFRLPNPDNAGRSQETVSLIIVISHAVSSSSPKITIKAAKA